MTVALPIEGACMRIQCRMRLRVAPIITMACHCKGNEGFGEGNFRALSEGI